MTTETKPKTYKIPIWTCKLVKDGSIQLPSAQLNCYNQVKTALQKLTGDKPVEYFVVFYLDGRNNVTGTEILAKGGQHGCALSAKDVFRGALVHNASAIVVGHNHPSGDPKPSREDIAMTESLITASEAIGIPLLDHVIVAFNTDESVSLFELGILSTR